MITSSDDALKLHREVSRDLWDQAAIGSQAVAFVQSLIEENGVRPPCITAGAGV